MGNRNFVYGALLSLISPFLVLILFIKRSGFANRRLLLIILVVIFGLTLPMTEAADGYRHQQMVINEYLGMSWERFFDDLVKILTFEITSSSRDVYKHLISFLCGGILQTPSLFFFVVSLVYGYFYSGVLFELFHNFYKKTTNKNIIFWLLVILFFLNRGVEGIQTVRTWTGLWVLFYGVLKYERTQQKKYLLVMLLAPFIHFGYFIMAIPAYAVVLFGSYHRIIGIIFIISTVTSFLDLTTVQQIMPNTSLAQDKIDGYGLEEDELSAEARLSKLQNKAGRSERTWYKKLDTGGYNDYPKMFLIYLLILFNIPGKFMNALEKKMYSVGVATLAGANILIFIFAVANRMEIIGLAFVLASLILMMMRSNQLQQFIRNRIDFRWLLYLFFLSMIPQTIFWVSFFLSQVSTFYLACPFYPILYEEGNIPLIDSIKWLIRFG